MVEGWPRKPGFRPAPACPARSRRRSGRGRRSGCSPRAGVGSARCSRSKIAYEGTWVVVSDPELVKQVFTGDPKVFHAGEGNDILRPLLGEHSLLTLDEAPHMSQRKLLLPPFHGKRMAGYEETMREIAAREIESWPTGVPYRLRPRMQAMTLEIIIETVFGVHGGERLDELREALRDFLDMLTNPRMLVPILALGPDRLRAYPPFRRRVDRVAELIVGEIADRRTAADLEERDDILSLLVAARHEDGSPMSDAEIHDELLTLLVAGHETTATALSWAVERLIRHPDKLARLREEVEAGEEAYLTATIQETLRLRPVIVDRHPPPHRGDRAGRLRAAAGVERGAEHPPGPPRPDDLPGAGRASVPSASSRRRPAPTPGSRSAAACAVASAPPSPSRRWRSSCASWSPAARSAPPIPPPSATSAVRSPRRPAATPRSSSPSSGGSWVISRPCRRKIITARRTSPKQCATRRRSSIPAMPTTRSRRCTRSTRTTTGR